MEIDEDSSSADSLFKKPSTTGLNFQNFHNRSSSTATTSSVSTTTTPIRSTHYHRRGSSGLFFNTMFCMSQHFRHLKRLHMESMEGLNIIKQPPARAVFRSSLPATPIATPIYHETFPFFTEQSLMERLCRSHQRTPSPRSRPYSRNSSQMDTSECEQHQQQMQSQSQSQPQQPMDICSPSTIDEESLSISSSSNSTSSPNKQKTINNNNNNNNNSNDTISDIQSSLNDIYYKINEQFNPD